MRLIGFKHLTGKIVLESGLHIGGSRETTQIGGMDNPVIRQPKDSMPYIPGSSLKGKMRSLLELSEGKVGKNGGPHSYEGSCAESQCIICRIFGASGSEDVKTGPARLIVRDCLLDKENDTVKRLLEDYRGLPLSEEKAETAINRIKGAALGGSLRKIERVPAGTVFNLDITFRLFDKSDEGLFKQYVLKALALVEKDGLGGCISRGYGKVKFEDLQVDGKKITLPEV
jgi:CRISPR-associated protein Csm3